MPTNPIPANYTEVLGNIIEDGIDIFDFDYTLWHPADVTEQDAKTELETAFISHFYMREIGQETVELFKHYLSVKWVELLETYNKLFEAAATVKPSDAFENDKFDYENNNIFNDAPKGVVEFDKQHATNYSNSTGTNKGLRGLTRNDALRRYSASVFSPRLAFFDALEGLFFGLFY